MKNNDQRKQYVRNEENWRPIEIGHYVITKMIRYKGREWLKICHLTEYEKYDMNLDRKVVQEYLEKGLYTVSKDGNALVYTNETEIVDQMRELDKLYPDNEGHTWPDPADTPRKGSGPWTV